VYDIPAFSNALELQIDRKNFAVQKTSMYDYAPF